MHHSVSQGITRQTLLILPHSLDLTSSIICTFQTWPKEATFWLSKCNGLHQIPTISRLSQNQRKNWKSQGLILISSSSREACLWRLTCWVMGSSTANSLMIRPQLCHRHGSRGHMTKVFIPQLKMVVTEDGISFLTLETHRLLDYFLITLILSLDSRHLSITLRLSLSQTSSAHPFTISPSSWQSTSVPASFDQNWTRLHAPSFCQQSEELARDGKALFGLPDFQNHFLSLKITCLLRY